MFNNNSYYYLDFNTFHFNKMAFVGSCIGFEFLIIKGFNRFNSIDLY